MNLPGEGRPGAAGALRYGLQQAILDCAIEGSEEEMAEILTEDLQAKPLSGPQVRQSFQAPPHQWQQLQAMQGQGKPGGYMTLPPVNRGEYMTLPPPKITVKYVTLPPLRGPNGK